MKSSMTAIGSRRGSTEGRVKLLTRSGLDWTANSETRSSRRSRRCPSSQALIDGELVVENDTGASDFSALQADLSEGRHDISSIYAFDLLYLDGYDLRGAPLVRAQGACSNGFLAIGRRPAALQRAFRRGRRD